MPASQEPYLLGSIMYEVCCTRGLLQALSFKVQDTGLDLSTVLFTCSLVCLSLIPNRQDGVTRTPVLITFFAQWLDFGLCLLSLILTSLDVTRHLLGSPIHIKQTSPVGTQPFVSQQPRHPQSPWACKPSSSWPPAIAFCFLCYIWALSFLLIFLKCSFLGSLQGLLPALPALHMFWTTSPH